MTSQEGRWQPRTVGKAAALANYQAGEALPNPVDAQPDLSAERERERERDREREREQEREQQSNE